MRDRLIELIDKAGGVATHHFFDDIKLCPNPVERIADHLLSNGVIVPPCKVGDSVFVLTSDSITGFEKSRVKRMLLKNLQDGMTIKIIIPCVCDDWGGAVREFYPEDFGKTVFLTQAEAEQALRKEDEGK